ncbi:MAG: ferredoxin oxidoreductase [Aquificota bacterium]|nr:MAG: ferredoxin oxidoreductase [Aquificota bacterium]
MYYVAKVDQEKCATYNCRQCTLFCPEANTLMFDEDKNSAFVNEERCKGCALCVYVCSDLLKRDCIKMEMIT